MIRRMHEAGVFPVRFLLLAAWLSIFGCAGGTDVGNPVASILKSDQALLAHISDQYAQSAQPTDLQALNNDVSQGWVAGMYSAERGHAETDVAEPGPNEADQVKTDGKNLYINGGDEVKIVSVSPIQAMQVISRIPVPGTVDLLYLRDAILVIIYTPTGGEGADWRYNDRLKGIDVGLPYWIPVKARTGILVMDVENPASPAFLRRMEVEGNLLSSFLIGDNLYLISQFMPDLPSLVLWHDGTEAGKSAAIEVNREALKALTINDVIPSYASYDENGLRKQAGRLVSTEKIVCPAEEPGGGTVVSVVAIPLWDSSAAFSAMGFVADIHYVHASKSAAYLISTLYRNGAERAAVNQTEIYRTRIYQLDILGATITYAGEGTVNGHLLDPFSLNEYNDVLRIATTSGSAGDNSATNQVYCLENTGGKLEIIGRAGVAPGERLHSARFAGDRGFLATVEQTAPLRTVDLSDPRHPAVVGELRVPGGHAAFLYPVNNDYLLVLGRNTPDDCDAIHCGGIRLSLYDIRDFATPRLLSTQQIGDSGTDSEALYNHKAFTFRPEERLLAFPVNLYEFSAQPEVPLNHGENTFNGLYVYRLMDNDGIEFKGRMAMYPPSAGIDGSSAWIRGVILAQDIYAVSSDAVGASPVDDIRELSKISLK